ncbi:MAG: phosphate ABC transporter permease subunit PstC [Victivallales bacterium]|nr:phosphate ABC transporter permease subunit PstC [Victivallales bacterium]
MTPNIDYSRNSAEIVFERLTKVCAFMIILLMAGFFVQLFWYSLPSLKAFGVRFLFSSAWDPVRNLYGAAGAVYGTLVTTLIALIIAVPLSFIIALFLVELAPPWLGTIMSQALDLLAAIPSIIYGMWGLFVLIPIMQDHVQPFIGTTLGLKRLPLFGGEPGGSGYLTGGLVLALMVLPFICAVMRDVFKMVPRVVKEAAYGIGCTTTEVACRITLRYGLQGMLGAVFLGLGRAVGETMALLYVIGNAPGVSASLFAPGTTIAATLANNFAEADGLFKSSLFELGLILLCITFIIQVAAQLWLNRVRKKSGGGL